jgi:hypothetical protein|tara:strand:+ start:299 stop:487 length:189 start_codon:yes stop_codon:yes gene_type:complete
MYKSKTYYIWYLAKKNKDNKYYKKPKIFRIGIKKFMQRLNYWGAFGSKIFQTKKEAVNYYKK